MRDLIYVICESFYKKVVYDVLIGYHFEKFRDPQTLEHHLERITTFWEMQFTGGISKPLEGPGFRLLFTHLQLGLKKGEVGRWIVLFHQTLDEALKEFQKNGTDVEAAEFEVISDEWKKKIEFFKMRFESHPQMFSPKS